MKKAYYFLVSVLLFSMVTSCTTDPKTELIADFVQTIDEGVKADLKFKAQRITFAESILCSDSAKFYEQIALNVGQIDFGNKSINEIPELYDQYIARWDSLFQKSLKPYVASVANRAMNELNQLETNKKVFSPAYQKYNDFSNCKDDIIGNIWECEYSVFNPILQVKQQVTRKFIFNKDNTKVIADL